ncbi:MAG: TetR/AcrR family transcriptional regulator [Gammaproteobacteria bacterium]
MARRNDHTREELLDMALDKTEKLLAKKPMAAISARQIANEMGYTVGTLYTLYENVNDLFIHIYARTLDQLYQACIKGIKGIEDPLEKIRTCGYIYLTLAYKQPHVWEMMFSSQLNLNPKYSWVEEKVQSLFELLNSLLKELETGKTVKEIETAGQVLWSGVHGITVLGVQHRLSNSQDDHKKLIDNLIDSYTSGWMK